MLKTKKDIDRHVRNALAKLRSEKEKNLRGFTVAKLYYKVNEFYDAIHYVSAYLLVNPDAAPAHRLLGQCYQNLKKPEKALESFQISIQLDPKQPDLLIEVCKLILNDTTISSSKAQYWCDMAESAKVQNDNVFSLRLKLLGKDGNVGSTQMEERILREITNRPTDPNLRVRFVCYLIENDKIMEAFKYAFNLEMNSHDLFTNSAEWYNVVWLALSKYKLTKNLNRDWDYWLLLIICLEKQVFINFNCNKYSSNSGIIEIANFLFNFDQHLQEASQLVNDLCPDKELGKEFLNHFRGQFCLHAAALLFKKELVNNKNQWKETTKTALPLLLLAYQCGTTNLKAPWLKHCTEQSKQLIQLWNKQGAFRCSQAGRTLLSAIANDTENSISNQVNQIIGDRSPWMNNEELLLEIRQYCSDTAWRNKIYRLLFTNSDQTIKIPSSYFINNKQLAEPDYEIPCNADIETYEELAQYLKPQSLQHMTYLCLGNDNLADIRCKYFNGLNFTTQNLSFCGAESLNQLDIETFLYATAIQAKRNLQVEKLCFENYQSKSCGRPSILPFVNLQLNLCTDEQINWWQAAYQVYKNLTGDNLAELRANLSYGIEAVRGINGPKIDLIIVLKLGKIFIDRSQDILKPIEKNAIEIRAQQLFKYSINMYKMQNKGVLEPFRRIFKYANIQSSQVEREINILTEEAVTYLAARFFKNSEYEDCIEELSGIQLPFATYFQSQAYKKLDESNKTPKKNKKLYMDKAKDCLNQTLNLLGQTNIDTNHPLNSVIQSEISNLQYNQNQNQNITTIDSPFMNGNYFADNGDGDYSIEASPVFLQLNRSGRRSLTTPQSNMVQQQQQQQQNHSAKTTEIENMVKQIATTLSFLKEEYVDFVKPEVSSLKKEVQDLKDKITKMEENIKKKSEPPSRDDDGATNDLDDLYLIDDEIQNQLYGNHQQQSQQQQQQQQHHQQQHQTNMYGGYQQHQQQNQRMHTPNMQQQQQLQSHIPNPYNNSMYNPNYGHPLGYFPQYMMPPSGQQLNPMNSAAAVVAAVAAQRTPLGLGGQHLSYADPLNYNMGPGNQNNMQLAIDSRGQQQANSLFGLLTQNNQQPQQQQQQQQDRIGLQSSIQAPPLSISIQPSITQTQSPAPVGTANIWNKSFNNQPVEKGPPVNVVITNSDPLPMTNTSTIQNQPLLSVTIPPQHIKQSLIQNNEQQFTSIFSNFPQITNSSVTVTTKGSTTTSTIQSNFTTPSQISFDFLKNTNNINTNQISPNNNLTTNIEKFSFKQSENTFNRTSESADENDLLNKSTDIEYDPRPDFQPIIPLPAEIEVKTGEENEEILFCQRSKLFRFVDKEWKERGIGDIKILKNKEDGKIRILMRRDQTHKICANHNINGDMNIQNYKNEEKVCIWAANDFADEELKLETFLLRFKFPEKSKEFIKVFNMARDEMKEMENNEGNKIEKKSTNTTSNSGSGSGGQETSTTISSGGFQFGTISNFVPKTLFPAQSTLAKTTNSIETPTTTKPSPFAGFSFDKNLSTPNKQIDGIVTSTPAPFDKLFGSIYKNLNTTPTTPLTTGAGAAPNISLYSTPSGPSPKKDENKSQSDAEDDYVPTAQFKPVIQLPELVETQTGEENELILYEHRAKLLRFDKLSGEWKERGLGNIKILQHINDVNKVRLLMRREIVHKICCNQRLLKETKFKYLPNTKIALSWVGQDFAENELTTEMLTIRFKTPEICQSFYDAILKAQSQMSESDQQNNEMIKVDSKNTENNKQEEKKGFGDKFKPQPGAWSCKDCYTLNLAGTQYCIACESPKDDTVPKKSSGGMSALGGDIKPKFNFGFSNATTTTPFVSLESSTSFFSPPQSTITGIGATAATVPPIIQGFGDQFKPKDGSWSCKDCYTSNLVNIQYCVACESPKDDTIPKKSTGISVSSGDNNAKPKFTFGFGKSTTPSESASTFFMPAQSTTTAVGPVPTTTTTAKGFGDQFKPKEGSWSCKDCYTSNTEKDDYCLACESPKNSDIPKKETKNIFAPSNEAPKFTFGFLSSSSVASDPSKPVNETTVGGVVDLSTTPKFGAFGPPASIKSFSPSSFKFPSNENVTTTGQIGTKPAFSFDLGGNGTTTKAKFSFDLTGGGVGDNNQQDDNDIEDFALGKKEFSFVLKPKSPGKVKSPLKNNISGGADDDSDGDAEEEEENNTYFTPVIPLPDKVEVKTGEECETVLYCHRSKLFRYVDKEWKERGLGDVKILQHNDTKKLRVVMRREQILKICLNHVLNNEIEYKRKDDKSWLFATPDFSEGELETYQFCLRFKTKEIADGFMDAVRKALFITDDENNESIGEAETSVSFTDNEISAADKKLADELKLPYSFYTKSSAECTGCIGCDSENFIFPDHETSKLIDDDELNPLPLDISVLNINKANSSIVLKQSSFSGSNFISPSNLPTSTTTDSNKTSIFNVGFNNINNNDRNIFDGILKDDSNSSAAASKFVFSLDNLNSNTTNTTNIDDCIESVVNNDDNTKDNTIPGISSGFLFGNSNGGNNFFGGTGEKKSIFGGSSSIFGGNNINSITPATTNEPVKSIFGNVSTSTEKPKDGSGMFGQNSTFGGNSEFSGTIFGGTPFSNLTTGVTNITGSIFGSIDSTTKPINDTINKENEISTPTTTVTTPVTNSIFKSDSASFVSFASLAETASNTNNASSTSENPLAGKQGGFFGLTLQDEFKNFKKPMNNNTSTNSQDGNGNEEGENYDPHYDPIIELPKEIVVTTGEESEKKLFGERATLFRYDATNKEWKERGVGELKILYHPDQSTYRLLLRREQIHKCVLNHAINDEFTISPMNASLKAFCWASMNYAEEPPQLERLAARFKNADLANKFKLQIDNCLEQLKNRNDLLPEED